MNGVLANALKTVQRQIGIYGEQIQWMQAAAPTVADESKPWIATPGEPTSYPTSFLFTSAANNPFLQLIAGSEVVVGKLQGIMPVGSFVPAATDSVVRSDGSQLSIESISPLAPSGEPLMYYVVFRK
jgi:hypothetical protein